MTSATNFLIGHSSLRNAHCSKLTAFHARQKRGDPTPAASDEHGPGFILHSAAAKTSIDARRRQAESIRNGGQRHTGSARFAQRQTEAAAATHAALSSVWRKQNSGTRKNKKAVTAFLGWRQAAGGRAQWCVAAALLLCSFSGKTRQEIRCEACLQGSASAARDRRRK